MIALLALDPSREEARQWAVRELAKPEYQQAKPNLFERGLQWVLDHLSRIQGPSGPSGKLGVLIAVAVLAVVVIWAVRRSGGLHRNARVRSGAALEDTAITAAEHYQNADSAAAQQDWNTAVVERFRGLVRELAERTIITAAQGRTADEIAVSAASALPALGPGFAAAAGVFDDVHYGGRTATAGQDAALRDLVTQLRAAKVAGPKVGAA